jgi:methylase of polypeptide subunit release factors
MRPLSASENSSDLRLETYDGLEIRCDPHDRANERDFVLGVGPASRTLARLTIRRPVDAALDLGTGSGVQALLAARHARRVVAVDVSARALEIARLNARANGIENVEWREGSWLEPVREERFGLVVANPPYVVSPDAALAYRDSGEQTDALVRRLLAELPGVLAEGGFAQVLCNWVVGRGQDWRSPLEEPIRGCGCDAVLLKFAEQDPLEYAEHWHSGLAAVDEDAYRETVDRWVAYYREHAVAAIAFGLVVLRRRSGGRNWVRALSVPAAPTDRAGDHIVRLFEGWDWVRQAPGVDVTVVPAPGGRIVRRLDLAGGKERITLEVTPNAGFAARIDGSVADALAERRPLPAREAKRLVGLGLALTQGEG